MIYLSDIKDPVIKKYMSEECGNVFSVRVKSLIKAYGGYERLIDIWYQKNRFDNVSAYIVKYSGEFIARYVFSCGRSSSFVQSRK